MRWLLPLLLFLVPTPSSASQLWTNPCCTTTRAITTADSFRVYARSTMDSVRYNKRTGVMRAYPRSRVDSVVDLRCLDRWVVDIDSSAATLNVGDTVAVTATVTHCGGQIAPNVLMTWTSRDETIATVENSTQLVATITGVADGSVFIVGTSDGGGADSVGITVVGTCTPTATHICPSDNVATKVNAQAAGTSFTFGAGTFRHASFTPKSNMTFTGAANHTTILDGARVLTGWTLSGSNWAIGGQTQEGTVTTSGNCRSQSLGDTDNFPRCKYPEQLWVDGVLYRHVNSIDSLATQRWYFNYNADSIYIRDDPNGRTVETSVTSTAIQPGSATGVTVQGIVVKHYAVGNFNGGAIEAGTGWTLDDNWVTDNTHKGIRVEADNVTVSDNLISRNGQLGFSASGGDPAFVDGLQVLRNRVDSNNTAGWRRQFSAGAMKVTRSNGAIFTGNRAERNLGNGWWWDIDNVGLVSTSDTAQYNDGTGFFYEISWGCTFTNPVSNNNGQNPVDNLQNGAAVVISASTDCTVTGGSFSNNAHGVVLLQQDRGFGDFGEHLVSGANINNNTTVQTEGNIGFLGSYQATDFHLNRNNVFECNDYTLQGAGNYFNYENSSRTDNAWQTAGHDDGACTTITRN